ncbi:hypothetical protein HPULCUR_006429 [Helicostylum pulchrum]|uniref:Uncharacterized protein n=1 Tax=Helicostylum pulchrum TaxID=562976 RepID=A0ABP9Y1W1_9FUNG
MSQDQLKIQHALSRLELAKAIKTPEPGAIDAEPWSKSIIFNQPFIKQLLQQKEQLMNRRDVRTRQPQPPKLQNRRRKSHSNLNLEPKMSKLSMKRSMTENVIASPACLPSDSEGEEEEEEDEDEEEEDSDSDSDDENDDSEPFQVAPQQRPVSIESVQDDISSASRTSSINHPLTDEEEPMSPTHHHRRMTNELSTNEQYTNNNNKPTMEMMDPMYYQRMQQYQLQLQYQTQLQYQQAMMHQQQLYLRAQSPMVYLPTTTTSPSPTRDTSSKKRHMGGRNTDMRRRAEMMRNVAEFSTVKQSNLYYTLPLQAPVMRTNMNYRPNYHPF